MMQDIPPVSPVLMLATGLCAGGVLMYIHRWAFAGLVLALLLIAVWMMVTDWWVRLPRAEKPDAYRHDVRD